MNEQQPINVNVAESSGEGTNSVSLKLSTKGMYSWDVKIYNNNIEELKRQLVDLEAFCKRTYGTATEPIPSPPEGE